MLAENFPVLADLNARAFSETSYDQNEKSDGASKNIAKGSDYQMNPSDNFDYIMDAVAGANAPSRIYSSTETLEKERTISETLQEIKDRSDSKKGKRMSKLRQFIQNK